MCDLAGEVAGDHLTLQVHRSPEPVSWDQAIGRASANYGDAANHVIAIDQGLVVQNREGMRPVERMLASALMAGFGCGAHASNVSNASCYGPQARIWDFLDVLSGSGYRHEPMAVPRSAGRFFFECYPHPALIALFGFPHTLRYKVDRRDQAAWLDLIRHLRSLKDAELPLLNVADHVPEDLAQNKQNEDQLDALISAYVAAYFWWFGTERSLVLGSLSSGYIVTPTDTRTRPLFLTVFGPTGVNPLGPAKACRPAAVSACVAEPPREEPPGPPPQTTDDTAYAEEGDLVTLTVTDTGNVWCRVNNWMLRDRCEGWSLRLRFQGTDGDPVLYFVPFRQHGCQQGGMKPRDDDTRLEWEFITEGATRTTPLTYSVRYQYRPLGP